MSYAYFTIKTILVIWVCGGASKYYVYYFLRQIYFRIPLFPPTLQFSINWPLLGHQPNFSKTKINI